MKAERARAGTRTIPRLKKGGARSFFLTESFSRGQVDVHKLFASAPQASAGEDSSICRRDARYMGHVLTDNLHGLVVNAQVEQANAVMGHISGYQGYYERSWAGTDFAMVILRMPERFREENRARFEVIDPWLERIDPSDSDP